MLCIITFVLSNEKQNSKYHYFWKIQRETVTEESLRKEYSLFYLGIHSPNKDDGSQPSVKAGEVFVGKPSPKYDFPWEGKLLYKNSTEVKMTSGYTASPLFCLN